MELTKVKLSDVARVEISGVDKKSKPGQKSVRLCNFVDVYHNWAITQDMRDSFMEATASDKEIEALSIKKGQVAFTKDSETRDDIGIPTYIADDFDDVVLGYHNALITPDERKLNGKYLNAFMHSSYIQKYFENNASGSGQRYTLSNDTVNSIPILLPTIKEQEKIGNLFSFIDRKIALNKKMNQKLEAMAKRLYDYWFVQYDFPDKNGHPYKTTGGPMTYNPTLKREIPVGWEVKTLKECIKHINTGLNPRDNFVLGNGDIKYVTVKNLTTEGNIDFSGCDLIDEDALKKVHKRSDIAKGDVLYASICPLGRSYLINKDPIGWDINESVFSIRPNLDVISSEFLSMFLKDSAVVEKASKMATGSIFKGIRIKELENMIFAVPAKNVMESFSKQIKNLIELEHKNIEETTRLTALRDKLLPLLMNGQVVVG